MSTAPRALDTMVLEMKPPKPAAEKPKKSFGPESDFYQRLKGQQVYIVFTDNTDIAAKLLWVDRYSVGIRHSNGREQLVYKSGIATIEPDREDLRKISTDYPEFG